MEREYSIGALLVLVTIFVIALIIYFTVPEFSESVKQIADEVFGISVQLIKQTEESLQKQEAIRVFDSVTKCITELKSKDKKCTCYLENTNLPEGYRIRTAEGEGESKFLRLEDQKGLKVENTINLPLDGLEFFILKKDLTPETVPLQIFVIKSLDGKLRLNDKEFVEDTPAFYNCAQGEKKKICFVTKEIGEEAVKKIRKFNDCERTEDNIAENNMVDIFNSFIVKYERCKSLKDKNNCLCDQIDFKELLEGYEIFANQDAEKKETSFSLYYTGDGKPVMVSKEKGSKTIKNSSFGFDYKPLLREGYLKKWQLEVEGNIIWEAIKYLFRGKVERIPFIFKGKGDEMFLISNIKPKNIEKCSPEYVTISGKGCKMIPNRDVIIQHKRLIGQYSQYKYGGKSYKQIIEEQVKDPYMRLLISSIMATESGFDNEAININRKDGKVVSVDKGIMQFNDATAPGYGACHPKGCNIGDYREDPYISIRAAEKLLNDNLKKFEGKTYKEVFAIAAYNTGAGNVGNAIKKTGKTDPSWDEVRPYLLAGPQCYPYIVETYRKEFEREFIIAS